MTARTAEVMCTNPTCDRAGERRTAQMPDLGGELYLTGAIRCGACGLMCFPTMPEDGPAAGGQL